MTKIRVALFLMISLCSFSLAGNHSYEIGVPLITNYPKEMFIKSGMHSQNWSALQDHRGVMYFANIQGVARFDGHQITGIQIYEGANIFVRSMDLGPKGVVYVGAVNDFGYLGVSKTGKQFFQSLRGTLKDDIHFNHIFKVIATDQGIYFFTLGEQSFRYHNQKVEILPIPFGSIGDRFAALIDGRLFAFGYNGGVYEITGKEVHLLPNTERVENRVKGRCFILPFKEDQLLLFSTASGFFTYDLKRSSLTPFPTELDAYLKRFKCNSGIRIQDHYAFATQENGIVFMDDKGKFLYLVNKQLGLQSNNVYSLYLDSHQNLWATLEQGVSHLEISAPITKIDEGWGLENLFLSTFKHKGTRYVGTLKGAFHLPKFTLDQERPFPQFELIKDNKSFCFEFFDYRGQLLAAGVEGVITIHNNALTNLINLEGNGFSIANSPKFPDTLFVAHRPNSGISYLKLKPNPDKNSDIPYVFHSQKYYGNPQISVYSMVSDTNGDLWISGDRGGVFLFQFNSNDPGKPAIFEFGESHGLLKGGTSYLSSIKGDIYVVNRQGGGVLKVVRPEVIKKSQEVQFVPENTFAKTVNQVAPGIAGLIYHEKRNMYIFFAGQDIYMVTQNRTGEYITNSQPLKRIHQGFYYVSVDSDDHLWVGAQHGIYCYQFDHEKNYQQPFHTLIRRVLFNNQIYFEGCFPTTHQNGTLSGCSTQQPAAIQPILGYKENTLMVHYASPFYEDPDGIQYQFQLLGFDKEWSDWTDDVKKEYTNLPPRDYTFAVRSQNTYGVLSRSAEYSFTITPPWYQTIWAYFLYGLLLISFVYLGTWLNSKRLIAAKRKLEGIVAERTREVKAQKDELEVAYGQLEDANSKLFSSNRQLAEANLKLEKLATHDGLTGIPNHRKFLDFLDNEWKRGIRNQKPLSAILMDVDFFKLYNDYYGHQMGDDCLRKVAEAIRKVVKRPADLAARYGGEEFVILLSETDSAGAKVVAEQARKSVEELNIPHEKSDAHSHVTISLGVATIIPGEKTDPASLVKRADEALYRSKENGRNRVTIVC